MGLFDRKIKTAWVSGFSLYEGGLIDKLKRNGFKINVFEDTGMAVQELEKNKYELIVVSSELNVDGDVDDDFKLHLHECKNEGISHDYNCSKVSLYFIDRIKKGKKSEVNVYTPLVVIDYFCKFFKDEDKEKFILAGANNVINCKMSLDEIVMKLNYF